mmetsp:Transcript_58398/g.137609  ORF Transcript_58398/g.137609 Transcript_58398/m.137609 type:complete len:102 (-) Transcript_58398:8-313(-)
MSASETHDPTSKPIQGPRQAKNFQNASLLGDAQKRARCAGCTRPVAKGQRLCPRCGGPDEQVIDFSPPVPRATSAAAAEDADQPQIEVCGWCYRGPCECNQ